MRKLINRLVGLLLLALLAGGIVYVTSQQQAQKQAGGGNGGGGGFGGGKRGGRGGAGEVVPVAAAKALVKDVDVFLEGVGSARARNSVTVKPQVDGKIIAVRFREGQDVKKGDVLAKIDPTTYQAGLDQALAKKALDEAQLANARLDYERYTKVAPGVVTQKVIDTQRALVAQFTAQVQSDEAAIANARAILAYTDVVAPIDGRTGLRLVDEGNLVRSGDAGIVTITEIKPIAVMFTLPQQELPRITAAMTAGTLQATALDTQGRTAIDEGKLEVVDNQVDQSTGTVRLKAEFPNARLQLWPGQFANVRLRVEVLKQVVVVPTAAVQRGPSGTFVYVVGPEQSVAMHPIKITHQTDTETVAASGVADGDTVVTAGFARLQDGAKVSVAPEGSDSAPVPGEGGRGKGKGKRGGDTVSEAQKPEPPADGAARAAEARTGGEAPASATASEPAPAAATGPRGEGKRGDGKRRRREAASEAQ